MFQKIIEWADRQVKRIFGNGPLQRIVKNSSYLVSATGFTAFLGFIQGSFVVRALGPAGYGLWGAIKDFSGLMNKLLSFRINELVIRFVPYYEEKNEKNKAGAVFRLAGFLESLGAIAAFTLIVVFSEFGARWLTDSQTLIDLNMSMREIHRLFVLYGIYLLFNVVYDSSTGLIQVFNKFREQSIITAVQGVLTLIFILIAFFTDGGLRGIILAYMLGKAVGAIGMTWLAMMTARSRWGKGWLFTPFGCLKEDRKDLFSFAFSTKLSSIISVIAKESESLWVNGLLGNAAGGYYSLARYFITLLQIPISPLPNTTYPELTREAAKENWVEVKDILKKGTRLAAVYSVPVSLVLVVFGKLIIRLYSRGVDFLPAYPILVILVVGYFIMNLFYWNRVGLLTLNRPVYPTVVNFIFMMVKITLMFAFIPPMQTTFMAILFSGYLAITTGFAVVRIYSDLNAKILAKEQFLEGSLAE